MSARDQEGLSDMWRRMLAIRYVASRLPENEQRRAITDALLAGAISTYEEVDLMLAGTPLEWVRSWSS